jgi:ABC-type glycerol-3-phosphate transport system substrate-binding protein
MDSQSKKTLFQTITLIVFGLAAIIAIGIFAMNKGGSKAASEFAGTIEVWGTLPYSTLRSNFDAIQIEYKDLRINYTEKDTETFEQSLVEELANGTGPDIFMITPEMLIRQRQKLLTIPYTSFPESLFKTTYVDQAQLFLFPDGVVGFPMFINPMVMYVNNDMLTSNYVVTPPTTWDELTDLVPALTRTNSTGEITQSMIGMGTYDNVTHADSIIATLLFQSGDPITAIIPGSGLIGTTNSQTGSTVFDFYTGFANPQSDFYSFNTTQTNDFDLFISGRSAFYLGFANELSTIRAKNPNLNFDIHMMPTPKEFGKSVVYGQMTGWGISKMSQNKNLAIQVLQVMSAPDFINNILNGTWLAPARRDMLSIFPAGDALRTLIYKSAIISQGYLNPDVVQTAQVLQSNINQVNNGTISPDVAYTNWITDISLLLQDRQKALETETQ